MKNFPAWREPVNSVCVIALLKCIGSVGGVLSVQLYLAFLAPDQTAYVLFLAISALVVFLPGAPLQYVEYSPVSLHPKAYCPYSPSYVRAHYRRFFSDPERAEPAMELRRFVVAFVTVVIVLIASIGNAYLSDGLSHGARALFAATIVLLFLLIGFSLVFDTSCAKQTIPTSTTSGAGLGSPLLRSSNCSGLTAQKGSATLSLSNEIRSHESPAVYGELNVRETMATIDCWLMVFCTFATMAGNSVVSVNIAQISEAAGHARATPFLLTLYGTGSALGRKGCRIPHRFHMCICIIASAFAQL